jgi:hypothetical protein
MDANKELQPQMNADLRRYINRELIRLRQAYSATGNELCGRRRREDVFATLYLRKSAFICG